MSASEIVILDLWELLAEQARLHASWQKTRDEQDRRMMAAAWAIGVTHPGNDCGARQPRRELGMLCTPTVLTCHWLPRDGEDYWSITDHLGYRGACLGCGWVTDLPRRGRGAENLAVEDAHDHSHPQWHGIPVVEAAPSHDTPRVYQQLVARWGALLPEGWLDRGGPIRTKRTGPGNRHVHRRAPGGGYDLASDAGDATALLDAPGGQLGLVLKDLRAMATNHTPTQRQRSSRGALESQGPRERAAGGTIADARGGGFPCPWGANSARTRPARRRQRG